MAKESEVVHYLNKEDIAKAIEEGQIIKEKYPAFWKLYKMIEEMNFELNALQAVMESKNGKLQAALQAKIEERRKK